MAYNPASFTAKNIMSGTYGVAWLDGERVFEAKACEAGVEIQQEAIKQAGKLADGQKMTGYSGTGTLRINHVFSRAINKISASLKSGTNPEFTILSEVNDPASFGAERVLLKGVQFTTLNLINWELGVVGEQEMPFIFTDWEPVSTVSHA